MAPRRKTRGEFVRAWRVVATTDGRSWARSLVDGVNTATRRTAEDADAADFPDQQRDGEAWRTIAEILLERDPNHLERLTETGCRRATRLAASCPGLLEWGDEYWEEDERGRRFSSGGTAISFTRPGGFACYVLWKVCEAQVALDRVKQCMRCGKWFVDETRNKSAARCSAACTAKWWDRLRRRKARHAQYRGTQSKGRQGRRNP